MIKNGRRIRRQAAKGNNRKAEGERRSASRREWPSGLHCEKKSPRFSPRNVKLGILKLVNETIVGAGAFAGAAHGTYHAAM